MPNVVPSSTQMMLSKQTICDTLEYMGKAKMISKK